MLPRKALGYCVDLRIQHFIKRESRRPQLFKIQLMSNDQEITDIVIQLQRLQLQQSVLLQRITQLSGDNNNNAEENNNNTAEPASPHREFVIGDQVRIINPKPFQPNKGRIIKIGDRITVLAKSGTKIHRAAKNLVLEE